MRRMQLIEIEDHDWCPRAVRDGGTDWLGFLANLTRVFDLVAPRVRAAMRATGTNRVVDLCSGGGGPWLTLERALVAGNAPDADLSREPTRHRPIEANRAASPRDDVIVELTDLFPNLAALASLQERSGGRCRFRTEPVDATDVPVGMDGVRTMFNCFHHFPPERARAILADAVRKRRGIAIFEGVDRRCLPLLAMPLQAACVFAMTPWVRPFKWSRLLFTYVIPLIPFVVYFDGTVSMLRIYSPDELRELVATVPGHGDFDWDIGTTPIPGLPLGITHLVGVPRQEGTVRPQA